MTQYRIQQKDDSEAIVEARSPFEALGIHRKRGPHGLGRAWQLTRQPDGWIVASNSSEKSMERNHYRIKEVDWKRGGRYFPI
jgi:hypothetical protein